MAPIKTAKSIMPAVEGRVITRSKTTTTAKDMRSKRKADGSPPKETGVKRSAFCDVTNAKAKPNDGKTKTLGLTNLAKKVTIQAKYGQIAKTIQKPKQNENFAPPQAPQHKVQTRASLRLVPNQTVQKPKKPTNEIATANKVKTRLSNEFEKTDESLYYSALEETHIVEQSKTDDKRRNSRTPEEKIGTNITLVADQLKKQLILCSPQVPHEVEDFDKENWDDIFQISHYALDIFSYLKSREHQFAVRDYMNRQVCLSKWMRSLLIDWMVEIQESFELNHETLYLAVKLVDLYLSRVTVSKETLQLVGVASMFIASKYDERIPPLVDDFLYICDGAYKRKELLRMEIDILKVCDFDLGIPLSYRFLRRYARCAKVTMPILTLARFILELSLMEYNTILLSDSKLASATLYLALQMKHISGWTPTLQYYTGYKLEEIISIVHMLNNTLHRNPKEQLMTVRNKYSHKIFFEVAQTPLIANEDLVS